MSTTEGNLRLPLDTAFGVVASKRTDWGRRTLQRRSGLVNQFSGGSTTCGSGSDTFRVKIFDRFAHKSKPSSNSSFDVLAIIPAFNEADIIRQSIEHLLANGVRVHVIDNWSTDHTVEIVSEFVQAGRPVVMDRYPADGPTEFSSWEKILMRVQEVAAQSGADWVIRNDADEFRVPCWLGMSLREALWMIEQWGYNCIDYTVVNFRPVRDDWIEGSDPFEAFSWFEFGDHPAHFYQLGTWKPQRRLVDIASSGGHEAIFDGRRIFPYKFLLRHYPIRSQAHGEGKVHRERRQRWSPAELARGWHLHYPVDDVSFIWNQETLYPWEKIDDWFLLQRLSGVGLSGNPRPDEIAGAATT